MQIHVKLSSAFKQYSLDKTMKFIIDVEEGTTTQKIASQIGIPKNISYLAFINGLHTEKDTLLNEGDTITILPLAGGG